MSAGREVVAAALIRDGRLLPHSAPDRRSWPVCGNCPEGRSSPARRRATRCAANCARNWASRRRQGSGSAPTVPLRGGLVLRAYRAELVTGTPQALEHAALRWVDALELREIALVGNDRGWLPELVALLGG